MRFAAAIALLATVASFTGVEAGHKKKVQAPRTLCPGSEIACPILGSTTYSQAVAHHNGQNKTDVTGIMAGSGGYECVNTMEALDSCGGCASTGEGQDCTKIRGAAGVGCESGHCVVFSCQSGWRPSLSGTKCVRAADLSRNSTRTASKAGAKRHLKAKHARHHGHAHLSP
ncbi:hypothetical protein JCM10296v2_001415 [Rhodotorula toruloides]